MREAITAAIEPLRADKSVGSSARGRSGRHRADRWQGYLKALGEEYAALAGV